MTLVLEYRSEALSAGVVVTTTRLSQRADALQLDAERHELTDVELTSAIDVNDCAADIQRARRDCLIV